MTAPPNYASPVDTATYGEYRINRDPADPRPLYRFTHRITADGSSGFPAEHGRYHLYAGWFCPWSHRVTLELALHGLTDVISVSYVDGRRDGRGWAFRERYGADPVNGFHLLREAYEATEPGFDGHVSVPTLWDRQTGQLVSNDYTTLAIDVATQFARWGNGIETYPGQLRTQIEELDAWIGPAVNQGVAAATGTGPEALEARRALLSAFESLDSRFAGQRYLLGDQLTSADVRLWVSLVRFDAASNARRAVNAALVDYRHLWAYARDLYQLPAFRETTDLAAFTAPGAVVPDWDSAPDRAPLAVTS
jgi:putative glutathione S-transferase